MPQKETVTKIIDGDTFKTAKRTRPIRLSNVDAPEKGTKGGAAATNKLRGLIGGEKVTVNTVARDKYGRAVADVKVGNKSVNKAMKKFVKR